MAGIVHRFLFKKITRPKLEPYLKQYATDAETLDIGSSYAPYKSYFPNSICLDIRDMEGVDVVGDAHDLPFEDNRFEMVLLTHVLDDCIDPFQVGREIERVLKPGGTVLMTVPFLFAINDGPHDYWRFTPYSLRKIFAPLDEIEIVPLFGQIETIAVLLQRIAFQSTGSKVRRVFYAAMARLLAALPLDRVMDQGGYPSIERKQGSQIDSIASAMYLAVFQKPTT